MARVRAGGGGPRLRALEPSLHPAGQRGPDLQPGVRREWVSWVEIHMRNGSGRIRELRRHSGRSGRSDVRRDHASRGGRADSRRTAESEAPHALRTHPSAHLQ